MALAGAALPLCSVPNLVRRFQGKWGNRPDRGPSGINENYHYRVQRSSPAEGPATLNCLQSSVCASQDTGHAELGVLLALVRRDGEEVSADICPRWLSEARDHSHVLDVSRAAGSALSTGRSPSCTCGPVFRSSPPWPLSLLKSVRKKVNLTPLNRSKGMEKVI